MIEICKKNEEPKNTNIISINQIVIFEQLTKKKNSNF